MQNEKQVQEFIQMVKQMREAQTDYFKTRNRNSLQRSIMLEKIVDKMIKEHEDEANTKSTQMTINFDTDE